MARVRLCISRQTFMTFASIARHVASDNQSLRTQATTNNLCSCRSCESIQRQWHLTGWAASSISRHQLTRNILTRKYIIYGPLISRQHHKKWLCNTSAEHQAWNHSWRTGSHQWGEDLVRNSDTWYTSSTYRKLQTLSSSPNMCLHYVAMSKRQNLHMHL